MESVEYMMALTRREQEIYNWLQDDLSREIFLTRKQFGEEYSDIDIASAIISNQFERFFVTENPRYGSLSESKKLLEEKKCIIYGYGAAAKRLIASVSDAHNIVAVWDKGVTEPFTGINGASVMPLPESRREVSPFDYVVLGVIVAEFRDQALNFLLKLGVPEDKIRCAFLLDDTNQYFDKEIIQFDSDEIFIDGGCFNFATSARLLELNPKVKKIYAYEPDQKNLCMIKDAVKKSGFHNVIIAPFAWWSENTELIFESSGRGGAKVAPIGTRVTAVAIDSVVPPDEEITFIKLDVEGAELEVLKGAEATIRRCRPKLAVAIYHKQKDYFEIAEYIKAIVPEYRAHIRHYSSVNVDTVLYCVI